jgi:hypothetical protein
LETSRLKDVVTVRGRFHRSVNLARDWSGGRDFSEYIVTPGIQAIGEQIVEELARRGGTRAWSLTGPYGTGKSAFSLFLSDVLATPKPALPEGQSLRRVLGPRSKPFVPVLVQAERGELLPLIAASVERAARILRSPFAKKARTLLESGAVTGESVAALLEQFAADAPARGHGGIALFVDEFGKFLEYASGDPARRDVFALQQLAEAASRSPVPILFVTILHSGFADYLSSGDDVRRAEWQKVQGRFRDVSFQLPTDQLISLIAHALETKFPVGLEKAYGRQVDGLLKSPALKEALSRGEVRSLLSRCVPLHPLTVLLLWPLFRSKVAQNERSLFAFLTSHEPFSFQEFLSREVASKDRAPLYGLPELYDYVVGALGLSTFTGADSRRWSLIDHALARVPAAAPPIARDLVKSVGLLTQYGSAVGLTADAETLEQVLGDRKSLDSALELLVRESILIYRRHSRSYGLWEGSDLDLDAAFDAARVQVSGRALHERFDRVLSLNPIVARAHYVETGTLRFFDSVFAPADARAVRSATECESIADGSIVFLVGTSTPEEEIARQVSAWGTKARITLVAVPRLGAELSKLLLDFECWEWINDHVPELQGDLVARQEVRARLQAARLQLEQLAGPIFGLAGHALDPSLSTWYVDGQKTKTRLESSRDLQRFLSSICADTYGQAPRLQNELLNRHNLSSAAARARRNLIERMLQHASEPRLGIEGFPPELSMYRSMLEAGRLHVQVGDRWQFKAPPAASEWVPAWHEIEGFLKSATASRRPLIELMNRLRARPLGLRDGPIPVLITCALIVKGDEVAIYEDGIFAPSFSIEMLERLLRRPETFEIQSYKLTSSERKVLEELRRGLDLDGEEADAELVSIARALVKLAAKLPPYTRQTRRLEPKACAVRDALLAATDPKALLFRELPEALEINLKGEGASKGLTSELADQVQTLTRAYPSLLDTVGAAIRAKLNLPDGYEGARNELARRSAPLIRFVSDERLQVFVREASRVDERDWREVLGRAINDGKPPTYWRDHDVDALHARLESLANDFGRIEALVAKLGSTATRVVSFSVLDASEGETRVEVSCVEAVVKRARRFIDAIEEALPSDGGDLEAELVALAEVAARIQKRRSSVQEAEGEPR